MDSVHKYNNCTTEHSLVECSFYSCKYKKIMQQKHVDCCMLCLELLFLNNLLFEKQCSHIGKHQFWCHVASVQRTLRHFFLQDKPSYAEDFGDSDQEDEPDAYLARVKAEAEERDEGEGGESEDESTDEDFNPDQQESDVAEE